MKTLFLFFQVLEEVAEEFASSVEAIFVETSARTNKNVHWLFEELCKYSL